MRTTDEIMKLADEYATQMVHAHFHPTKEARAALLKAVEEMAADAARYRWLRHEHWSNNIMAVVLKPKDAVKLGYECPSGGMLNVRIDEAMKKETP